MLKSLRGTAESHLSDECPLVPESPTTDIWQIHACRATDQHGWVTGRSLLPVLGYRIHNQRLCICLITLPVLSIFFRHVCFVEATALGDNLFLGAVHKYSTHSSLHVSSSSGGGEFWALLLLLLLLQGQNQRGNLLYFVCLWLCADSTLCVRACRERE